MIPVQFIVAGVIAVTAFGAGWKFSGDSYAKQLSDLHAKHSLALAEATENARAVEAKWHATVAESERVAAAREADMRRDLARVRSVANGLRNEISATRATLPDATPAAVIEYASIFATISTECGDALVEMAGIAESHRLDTLKLLEAWPK